MLPVSIRKTMNVNFRYSKEGENNMIVGYEVQCFNRKNEVKEGEKISDDIDVELLFSIIQSYAYYFRKPEDCPFGRGNWMLDVHTNEGRTISFKYPKEMNEERFIEFIKPLTDLFKQILN